MTQVEKIKSEIDRLQDGLMDANGNFEYPEHQGAYNVLCNLDAFIDSLSDTEKDFGIKESVIPFGALDSKLMEATYFIPQGYHAVIDGNKVIIKKGEEPVSNDLEEAARKIATRHSHITGDTYYANDAWFFKKGAQWQKERMIEKACEWLKSYRQDTPDGSGYIPGIINDKTIEEFKKAMEE